MKHPTINQALIHDANVWDQACKEATDDFCRNFRRPPDMSCEDDRVMLNHSAKEVFRCMTDRDYCKHQKDKYVRIAKMLRKARLDQQSTQG